MTTTEVTIVENKNKDRRSGKGRCIALSRKVYRIQNSDTFYVESETTDNIYYFVRYEPSFHWCSCLDNSTRHVKCKHQFAIEYAIRMGTLKDTDKLPAEAKRYPHDTLVVTPKDSPKSFRDDDYDF